MEFVGFVISLVALTYIFFKQQASGGHRLPEQKQPPLPIGDRSVGIANRREERGAARKNSSSLPEFLPPPVSTVKRPIPLVRPPLKEGHLSSAQEQHRLASADRARKGKAAPRKEGGTARPLASLPLRHREEEKGKLSVSKAQKAIERLSHRRDLIIYQEIIGPPKSLRVDSW